MFKAIRIGILLFVLLFVMASTWLTKSRSTDWNNSLWVKIYPINADGSDVTARYIENLDLRSFLDIETFVAREAERHGKNIARPVRLELGDIIREQPPAIGDSPQVFDIMWWSLKMRWWVGRVTDDQDKIEPDVSIFVRYHQANDTIRLEDSVGVQKGMFGIVNAYSGRRYRNQNNVIIAHEFFHTLGASDKYEMGTGQPIAPDGLADPDRKPLYPQRRAEIMAGRVALAKDDSDIAQSLNYVVVGTATAAEIHLID
jgi:hypothetical protein